MKIKPQAVLLVSVAIVLIGIAVTIATGFWTTQSKKIPQKFNSGEVAGQYNPADIRGSYTFSDISKSFDVPLSDLAKAFGVGESEAAAFQCKQLESIFADSPVEVGTASVRMFVAYYLGLPYEATEESYLTEQAVEILKARSELTPERLAFLESHTVKFP